MLISYDQTNYYLHSTFLLQFFQKEKLINRWDASIFYSEDSVPWGLFSACRVLLQRFCQDNEQVFTASVPIQDSVFTSRVFAKPVKNGKKKAAFFS